MKQPKGLEREIKLLVHDLGRISERLQAQGAELIQDRVRETNLRFDLPDRRLEKEKKALRLRFDSRARLTYKGPSEVEKGTLTRVEYETVVDDFDATALILEALGYIITVKYEKFRTTYAYQDCEIMLDELPIGTFVEIEGTGPEELVAAALSLGLDTLQAIPMSYIELFNRICEQSGFDKTQLTFTALDSAAIDLEVLDIHPADQEVS